jgi:hypothetical protein
VTLLLLQAWLKLIKQAVAETDVSQIMSNREAQHRYLTWRAEKVINFFPSSSFMHMPSWHHYLTFVIDYRVFGVPTRTE